ncbi:hypothetical protein HAX54_023154 [Datura stramonium]|uniref:Uncharacterized protein n=1 Tax=Datura stramonium TaxID=4076 RepID=A0ABS8UY88_DATST|nr:hypothetical protein [Datura stramonium]
MNGLPISVYAPETVGCGGGLTRIVYATSTGADGTKWSGRIGDSPLIGADLRGTMGSHVQVKESHYVEPSTEVAYGLNCNGMFRGCATEDGFLEVGIWEIES